MKLLDAQKIIDRIAPLGTPERDAIQRYGSSQVNIGMILGWIIALIGILIGKNI